MGKAGQPSCTIEGATERIIEKRAISSPYNAVSTLPKLLGNIVTLVNDEVLIEDLEDLTALEISHLSNFLWLCFES